MNNKFTQGNLPVFINKYGGTAHAVIKQLEKAQGITIHVLPPEEMAEAIQRVVDKGLPRIVVSGGDGTLALAAGIVANSNTEMAILPGGTLNHFAKRLNIPLDISAALQLALTGTASQIPFGMVNDQLFLNTSSVGAYVTFVQTREKLENRLPYFVASFFAAIRRLYHFRQLDVRIDGQWSRTPLVFVGIGERELQLPTLGDNKYAGKTGLHLIILRCSNGWAALSLAIQAMLRGVDPLAREQQLEHAILQSVEVTPHSRKKWITVSADGELLRLMAPLHYQFHSQGLNVITPDEEDSLP